jgi:hypothetical protein
VRADCSSGFQPENDEFQRFELGIPPKKNGDWLV